MGVPGLLGFLKCLTNGTPSSPPDWSAYKGKKIGIDILGFLYRAKSRRQSTILYIARMIAAFRRCGLEPVPVFDGKSPTEKRSLLEERASLRTSAARRPPRGSPAAPRRPAP
jgi:5'-3' exonuclease